MPEQPVAIVTGAARGIGAATAKVLAERGYRLALVDCERGDLETVCAAVAKFNVDVLPQPGDLSDLSFAESVVQRTAERWQRIDLLVNNAAWRELATMRTISVESWEKTLRIGLTTPAFMARWAAKHMEPRRSGVIVNISSIMAERAGGISPAYAASKGALSSLTYELASLYGPCGIRVVGICPGAIDTELSRDLSGTQPQASDPLREFSEDMIMLRRWGSPEEIAKVVAWVASDEATYITGTNLIIDGGWLHQHFPHSLKRQTFPQEFGE
jgi:NAD(P)-dependent dehydrogenase (short-subunit alcohol dehydrogenase family)